MVLCGRMKEAISKGGRKVSGDAYVGLRMSASLRADLRATADELGSVLGRSDLSQVVRMAVQEGLPGVRARFSLGPLNGRGKK